MDRHIGRGVKPGLERIRALLDLLAGPDESYPIIHIAGSNGKTSTARMVSRLVSAHGLTAGLFTSPHLDSVEQRFELSGFPMTRDEFAEVVSAIGPVADLMEEGLTYFELTAALAFAWFSDRAADVGVIETGLGGRLDATNAAESEVAVVTNIALEHTDYLGGTIEEIAVEKLGILDRGADLVTGPLEAPALAAAGAAAAERSARWFHLGRDFGPVDPEFAGEGWVLGISGIHDDYPDIDLHLRGRHQVANFATAVAAVEALFDRALDLAAVREAAAATTAPGRLDLARKAPLLAMDGAHNPAGMQALAFALAEEFPGVSWQVVFGAMGDKKAEAMLEALRPHAAAVHAVAADNPRALPVSEVVAMAGRVADSFGHPSVAAGLEAALSTGEPVLVTGSIYVVGEARAALGIAPGDAPPSGGGGGAEH